MAVKVYWRAANGTAKESEYETGRAYSVSETGVLFVWNNSRSYTPDYQVAVHAPGQWLSAVVAQEPQS